MTPFIRIQEREHQLIKEYPNCLNPPKFEGCPHDNFSIEKTAYVETWMCNDCKLVRSREKTQFTEAMKIAKKNIQAKAKIISGKKKPRKGTKPDTVYESGRSFEYEVISFFQHVAKVTEKEVIVFRRPVSKSPADVWCITTTNSGIFGLPANLGTMLWLCQAKSSKNLKKPYKDKKELEKFLQFCFKLKATPFWASRWKVNKNKYTRLMESWDYEKSEWITVESDFSSRI